MGATYDIIVVGADGSPHGDEAVRTAGALAQALDSSEVHVVTGVHPISAAEWQRTLESLPREFWDAIDLHQDGHALLDEAAQVLAEEFGIDAETHLVEERPADAIIGVAQREHADLIVVGSRGRSLGGRALLGSVSTRIVHHAPCAVLVAGSR
jgi:nucleotide-binding universal stress UspA family protein